MKKLNNKFSVIVFIFVLVITTNFMPISVEAKKKQPKLSDKKIVMTVGKTKQIKIKNVSKKVNWKVIKGSRCIKITKKTGKYKNTIKVKAKKSGKAVIRVKYGKKRYKIKINVVKKTKKNNNMQEEKVVKEVLTEVPQTTEFIDNIKYVTITLDTYGLVEIENVILKMGDIYGDLPIPEVEGYVFNGWFTEPYGEGQQIKETDYCNGNITIYASLIYLGGDLAYEDENY